MHHIDRVSLSEYKLTQLCLSVTYNDHFLVGHSALPISISNDHFRVGHSALPISISNDHFRVGQRKWRGAREGLVDSYCETLISGDQRKALSADLVQQPGSILFVSLCQQNSHFLPGRK